jgi:hypothetical protein
MLYVTNPIPPTTSTPNFNSHNANTWASPIPVLRQEDMGRLCGLPKQGSQKEEYTQDNLVASQCRFTGQRRINMSHYSKQLQAFLG